MPTARKPAKKDAEKKAAPSPVEVDGFRVVDYEGLDSLECMRPKCGFQTFDVGSAKAHTSAHEAKDADRGVLADLVDRLPEVAQVTTEEEPTDEPA